MRPLRILMYHAIGEPGEAPAHFRVPVREFERQMAWLALLRFSVLPLEYAVRRLMAGEALPRRSVSITFDDGTCDQRTLALPILRRYAFPATAFVVTGLMGERVSWTERPELKGRSIMTWTEALELPPLVSLEPHTRTHPSLPTLTDDKLLLELRGSREDLEARTGKPHVLFAYPYGHFDDRVAAAAADAGFIAACSVKWGLSKPSTPHFALRRYDVGGRDSLRRFLRTVCLAGSRKRIAELLARGKR